MLRRLYIHNYKCFQNFTLDMSDRRSVLIVGKNGTGKTALMEVLSIFQAIGRGEHRVDAIFNKDTLTIWRKTDHCFFELEVSIAGREYLYSITLDLPTQFTTARVIDEKLIIDGNVNIERELDSVSLNKKAVFPIDWHLFALPIIHSQKENASILEFREWLANMLLLSPIPKLMGDIAAEESLYINIDCTNFADYFTTQCANKLELYSKISENAKTFMEDFTTIDLVKVGEKAKRLDIVFDKTKCRVRFSQLSDGEKKFILHAVVLAICASNENTFVFWDEPDNYLANAEIQAFVRMLRQHTNMYGQSIITSHNKQTAICFSKESTLLLTRRSHIDPSEVRCIPDSEDFISIIEDLQI